MKTSDKGKEFIKSFESLRLQAYKCSAVFFSSRKRHTRCVTMDMVITEVEANSMLDSDVAQFDLNLGKFITKPIKQNQ